jgi:hypothetical protein
MGILEMGTIVNTYEDRRSQYLEAEEDTIATDKRCILMREMRG